MSYNYQTERREIFTEDGQTTFLKIRDNVQSLLKKAGAVRMQEVMSCATGSSWTMIACVDRLVELGELREIQQPDCAGQHRVFVATR